jgi:hypothetical protein
VKVGNGRKQTVTAIADVIPGAAHTVLATRLGKVTVGAQLRHGARRSHLEKR